MQRRQAPLVNRTLKFLRRSVNLNTQLRAIERETEAAMMEAYANGMDAALDLVSGEDITTGSMMDYRRQVQDLRHQAAAHRKMKDR